MSPQQSIAVPPTRPGPWAPVTEKLDSAALRLVQEAEQRAAAIRQEAESLATTVKRQSYQQADTLTAKATNLKAAAKPAADQLRKQADEKSAGSSARRTAGLTALSPRPGGRRITGPVRSR
jgi:hypothetical protein